MTSCKCCGSNGIEKAPYYEQVHGNVIQNHETVLLDTQYAAGIVIKDSFNIPAVDNDTTVILSRLTNIPVGAYLYNPAYGYLQISYYNPQDNTLGLLNTNVKGIAAPGTFVPENSIFIVSSKPCCEDDSATLFPFLAENFEVPEIGNDATLEVTSTFGLRLGEVVRIGTGLFRLDVINSSRQIVVTNEGAGGTPGSTVEARGSNDALQYLITAELASACAATTEVLGRLIVCTGSDEHILGGSFAGQVPVLQNAANDTVSFQFLDAKPRVCVETTSALNVTSGLGVYNGVGVNSVVGLVVNDLLEINFNSLRFKITAIGTNTLDLQSIPNPAGINVNIPAGSSACKILTTEVLQNEITALSAGLSTALDAVYVRRDGANATNVVATSWIFDDAVTFPKMQAINTDRLVGRDTAGAGDIEELAAGPGLYFTGSGEVAVRFNNNVSIKALNAASAVTDVLKLNASDRVEVMQDLTSSAGKRYFRSAQTVGATGTNQAGALQATSEQIYISAGAGGGVKLPSAIVGAEAVVFNQTGGNVTIYPITGQAVGGAPVNNGITLADNVTWLLRCYVAGDWRLVSLS